MAAVTTPERMAAQHQSPLHIVDRKPWSDEKVLSKAREIVLLPFERRGATEALIFDDSFFSMKWQHSLGVALMNAGYSNYSDLRAQIAALELTCAVGVLSSTTMWAPGTGPMSSKPWSGRERPSKLMRGTRAHQPVTVETLPLGLSAKAWHTIIWRQGANERLSTRIPRTRFGIAHRKYWRSEQRRNEGLLIEWSKGEGKPTGYGLSTLPDDIPFQRLVEIAKVRRRIGRDYREIKQEVGLGHSKGRGWCGFRHHATLCVAAYGYRLSERETISPSALRRVQRLPKSQLPAGYRPRGSAIADPRAHPRLDCDSAMAARMQPHQIAVAMPVLCRQDRLTIPLSLVSRPAPYGWRSYRGSDADRVVRASHGRLSSETARTRLLDGAPNIRQRPGPGAASSVAKSVVVPQRLYT